MASAESPESFEANEVLHVEGRQCRVSLGIHLMRNYFQSSFGQSCMQFMDLKFVKSSNVLWCDFKPLDGTFRVHIDLGWIIVVSLVHMLRQ